MREEWKKIENELLGFCSKFLYKLANFEELEDLHWVGGGHGDGESYCYDCCEKEVDKINKELIAKGEIVVDEDGDGEILHDEGAFIDGGWGGMEEDGCAFCDKCNNRLEASLTRYGVESEVDHFLSCDLIDQDEIDNDQIVELYNVFECSTYYNFSNEYKKDILRLARIVTSCFDKSFELETRFEILDL